MTQSVKRCYKLALKDEQFNQELISQTKDKAPGFFSSDLTKIIYATVYYGWLVGKGKYTGELKKYLSELDSQ